MADREHVLRLAQAALDRQHAGHHHDRVALWQRDDELTLGRFDEPRTENLTVTLRVLRGSRRPTPASTEVYGIEAAELFDTEAPAASPSVLDEVKVDLSQYVEFIVLSNGGKDPAACALHLLELGVPPEQIELHHHVVDGREGPPSWTGR